MSKHKQGHETPGPAHGTGHDGHGDSAHHTPTTGDFVTIFLILAFLTVVEVFIPKIYGAPWNHNTKMLLLCTLAFGKAMLVALFFMHLKWESPWIKRIAMVPLYMGIAAILLMIETAWRNTLS